MVQKVAKTNAACYFVSHSILDLVASEYESYTVHLGVNLGKRK